MSRFDQRQEVRLYDQDGGFYLGEVTRIELNDEYPFVEVDFANWIEKFSPDDLEISFSSFIDMRTRKYEEFWAVTRRGVITESYLAEQC